MSAQRLKQIARTPVPGWILLVGALLPLAAFAGGTARAIKGAVDNRYVQQAGYAMDRRTDSLNDLAESKDIRHFIDSTAKDLKSCIRHPEDCR